MFTPRNLIATLVCCVVLAGCDSQPPEDQAASATIAGTTFPNTVGEEHWLSFQRELEANPDAGIELKMLIYGQLGPEEQIMSGLRRGRVQFANLSAMAASTLVPELALLYAPFLFDSEAEADYVFDEYLTPVFRELLADKGLHLITWYEIGMINVYGREPLLTPDAAAGVRYRVGAGLSSRLFAERIGADVIPLGYSEVVSSLQTGLIEAGEQSVSLYARTGIADEAPHYSLTNHSFGVSVIVSSTDWWGSLTSVQQEAVAGAFPGIAESRRSTRAESAEDLADAVALGISVHELNAEQRASWQAASAGVTDDLVAQLGGRSAEILAGIREARSRFRSANP